MTLLMSGLEGVLYINEFQKGVAESAGTFVNLTASHASQYIDKVEPMKKARTGLMSAISLISGSVQNTIDKTIASYVLPAFGLPVDGVPSGKTAQEYLAMARKYEGIGLPGPTKQALEYAVKAAADDDLKHLARVRLVTRVPKVWVSDEVHTKMLAAMRHSLTGSLGQARDIYNELIVEEPKFEWPYASLAHMELTRGELERARDLVNRGLKVNSDSVKLLACRARIQLAEWKTVELEATCAQMEALEPGCDLAKSFMDILKIARKGGIA